MRCNTWLAIIGSLAVYCCSGNAQEVVSAQSGVIHYSEGTVLVDGVPFDRKPATFPLLKENSVLQTQKGRAELLLTPGIFLRLDDNSSVKMRSSALTSTSIEVLSGSAILDALAAEGDIPVTLQYKGASVAFTKPGLYRIDSDTEVLQAYSGEAAVKQGDKQTSVDTTHLYFFGLATDTKKYSDGTEDEFLDWARNRNQVITQENEAAQADEDDNSDPDLGVVPLFNYNVPPGNPGLTAGSPSFGTFYPYSGFYFNSYAPSAFWMLPPLPAPALIITRFPRRMVSPNWPRSGTWSSRHPGATGTWLTSHPIAVTPHITYARPITPILPHTMYSHPVYAHPMATHVAAPAVHAGRR